ncbi:hypothetical protein OIDMADRAFT_26299 [Oidiodendron maius Zn]|uniref:Hydrophobin n=1 Tax=Oidiodendron maius (strain Zn) TaxID=913774 RepID=A0A0C3HKS9_OIDMZ|nr:hypothetical protein OIDMADRAFT_26299 [Oidiodendron maius Zn]
MAATLLSFAPTAFVLVSAATSKVYQRPAEPEPVPEPFPEPIAQPDIETNNGPLAGVMCGTNQSPTSFLSLITAKTGSINGGQRPNSCTQVSCAHGVGISFCNDTLFPATVPYSIIETYAYDISVICFDEGKTSNGRKNFVDWQTSTRWLLHQQLILAF